MRIFVLLLLVSMCLSGRAGSADGPTGLRVGARLAEGGAVKIVCFGDSITGVYYHTGARRSWCDLLGIALARTHPAAQIQMINAGISGNDTAAALKRMEHDVLRHAPDLVVVMFGMNDVRSQAPEVFRRNLEKIVERAQRGGAEVILMTPNAINPDDTARSPERLLAYAQIVRDMARERSLPLADTHSVYAAILTADRPAWERLMSDNIHPNMRGHKIFAEEAARVITGRRVSLAELPALRPALPRVLARVRAGEPVRVVAMPPYDALIGPALRAKFPDAVVQVTPWQPDPRSLAAIEAQAKEIGWWKFRRESGAQPPDLVVVAVPSTARAPAGRFYRSYTWVLNWSLSMELKAGSPQWDCLVALPSVAEGELQGEARAMETQAFEVLGGQDIPWFRRQPGDRRSALELLSDELALFLAP